jgi:hypothetical protein
LVAELGGEDEESRHFLFRKTRQSRR